MREWICPYLADVRAYWIFQVSRASQHALLAYDSLCEVLTGAMTRINLLILQGGGHSPGTGKFYPSCSPSLLPNPCDNHLRPGRSLTANVA